MKYAFATTALAATLAIAAGVSHAQQVQQFGRDSLYAVPGKSASNGPTPPVASDAPGLQAFGRDSVYATNRDVPTTPVASNATGLQPYGRDSVFAMHLDAPQTPDSGTAVGMADGKGHGG